MEEIKMSGMMKRLLQEDDFDNWKVLPVLEKTDRQHIYTGDYRLLEHIGSGRWLERERGGFNELTAVAERNNKEGYRTKLTEAEILERTRCTVMGKNSKQLFQLAQMVK
jgi:hypothetical protein